jgi:hypothetical protein
MKFDPHVVQQTSLPEVKQPVLTELRERERDFQDGPGIAKRT